ncbi:unnamed protein product, partial [Phaeothamnion confervicola]
YGRGGTYERKRADGPAARTGTFTTAAVAAATNAAAAAGAAATDRSTHRRRPASADTHVVASEALRRAGGGNRNNNNNNAGNSGAHGAWGVAGAATLVRLRERIKERLGRDGVETAARALRGLMDGDRNSRVDRSELRYGLREVGVNVSSSELEALFAHFDADRNGCLSYEELLNGLRGEDQRRSIGSGGGRRHAWGDEAASPARRSRQDYAGGGEGIGAEGSIIDERRLQREAQRQYCRARSSEEQRRHGGQGVQSAGSFFEEGDGGGFAIGGGGRGSGGHRDGNGYGGSDHHSSGGDGSGSNCRNDHDGKRVFGAERNSNTAGGMVTSLAAAAVTTKNARSPDGAAAGAQQAASHSDDPIAALAAIVYSPPCTLEQLIGRLQASQVQEQPAVAVAALAARLCQLRPVLGRRGAAALAA